MGSRISGVLKGYLSPVLEAKRGEKLTLACTLTQIFISLSLGEEQLTLYIQRLRIYTYHLAFIIRFFYENTGVL